MFSKGNCIRLKESSQTIIGLTFALHEVEKLIEKFLSLSTL